MSESPGHGALFGFVEGQRSLILWRVEKNEQRQSRMRELLFAADGEERNLELGQQFLNEFGVAVAYRFQLYLTQPPDAYGMCCRVGEINDTVFGHGAPVIDADKDRFVISEVGNPDPASEGKAAVGTGEGVHVEGLAGCSLAALKMTTVPGCDADLEPVMGFCF